MLMYTMDFTYKIGGQITEFFLTLQKELPNGNTL